MESFLQIVRCIRNNMERLKILFWKTISLFWNFEPRLHLPKYSNEPILSTEIADSYTYPENCLILYEWDEKGKHWMVFSRSKNFYIYCFIT